MPRLIAALRSTKNAIGSRDPEMQTQKSNSGYLGMKVHIGVDAESGLAHTVITAANVHDDTSAHALLTAEETDFIADAGYLGVEKHNEYQNKPVTWHVTLQPGAGIWKVPYSAVS